MGDAIVGGDVSEIERRSTRRRSTVRRRVAVSVVVALALVGAACSNSGSTGTGTASRRRAPTGSGGPSGSIVGNGEKVPLEGVPGVTDDEIRFSAFGTRSNNPLGTCVLDCYTDGIEAYFAWRNSEGGVNGRQMVLSTVLDDELTQNQAAGARDRVGRRHVRGVQRHAGRRPAGATSPRPASRSTPGASTRSR